MACDRARLLPPLRRTLARREDGEIVDETPVLLCRRRGPAVDLVLDRPRQARSQFVFTEVKGREAIFWQTQKTARAANPGGRILPLCHQLRVLERSGCSSRADAG
jgi:hypothetical protein